MSFLFGIDFLNFRLAEVEGAPGFSAFISIRYALQLYNWVFSFKNIEQKCSKITLNLMYDMTAMY